MPNIISVRTKQGSSFAETIVPNFAAAIKLMQELGNVTDEKLSITLGKKTFVFAQDENGKEVNLLDI